MRKVKIIKIGAKEVTCQELTPRQIDGLLALSVADLAAPSLPILMASDVTTDAVLLSTGITADALLDDFELEELVTVWAAVEEVNSFLLARLDKAVQKNRDLSAAAAKTGGKP
jgi:hypothetical protein